MALRPYLGELVFVGGWAHRLHALHELASRLDFQPLMTADTDIAARPGLRIRGSSIRELLQKNGFEEKLSGDENPQCDQLPGKNRDRLLEVLFCLAHGIPEERRKQQHRLQLLGPVVVREQVDERLGVIQERVGHSSVAPTRSPRQRATGGSSGASPPARVASAPASAAALVRSA